MQKDTVTNDIDNIQPIDINIINTTTDTTNKLNTLYIPGYMYSIIGIITTHIIYICIRWNSIPGRSMRKARNNLCKHNIIYICIMLIWCMCTNYNVFISICATCVHSVLYSCILFRHEIINVNIRIYSTIICCTCVFAIYILLYYCS